MLEFNYDGKNHTIPNGYKRVTKGRIHKGDLSFSWIRNTFIDPTPILGETVETRICVIRRFKGTKK